MTETTTIQSPTASAVSAQSPIATLWCGSLSTFWPLLVVFAVIPAFVVPLIVKAIGTEFDPAVLWAAFIPPLVVWLYAATIRMEVTRDSLRLKKMGRATVLPLVQITGIAYSQDRLRGVGHVEMRDGRTVRFEVFGGAAPAVQRFLAAVESATGLHWTGWAKQTATFARFREALRRSTRVRNTRELLGWLVARTMYVRTYEAGTSDPLLRWAAPLVALPFAAGWFIAYAAILHVFKVEDAKNCDTCTLTFSAAWQDLLAWRVSGALVVVAAIALWLITTLGINILIALSRQQVRDRESLESELEAAREVQTLLFPAAAPLVRGFDLAGTCAPAQEVGGDYFDFITLPEGAAVAVADVSGKGLPAALLMTLVKGALKSTMDGASDLVRIASRLNTTVSDSAKSNHFVSLAVARLDSARRTATILRAGHNAPLLVSGAGEVRWIHTPGMALGLAPRAAFEKSSAVEEIAFTPGDLLLLYSDGVTEAMNRRAEEFGEDRLAEIARANRDAAASEIQSAILEEVSRFRDGAPPNDDTTLVVVKAV